MPEFQQPNFEVDDEERARRQRVKAARSTEGIERKWQQQDRTDLEAAERLNAPPTIVEPRCQVCTSPHREWIERRLVRGATYKAIAESIPDGVVDRRSVSNHAKKHMPLDSGLTRAILEEEASLLGQNIEEGVAGAFSMRGALNLLARKGFDDAMSGITTVEVRDIVQLVKAYNEMSQSASVQAIEEAQAAVRIYNDAIKNVLGDVCTPEQADEIKGAIVLEIKRLREQDEIERQIESDLRVLPSGNPDRNR